MLDRPVYYNEIQQKRGMMLETIIDGVAFTVLIGSILSLLYFQVAIERKIIQVKNGGHNEVIYDSNFSVANSNDVSRSEGL